MKTFRILALSIFMFCAIVRAHTFDENFRLAKDATAYVMIEWDDCPDLCARQEAVDSHFETMDEVFRSMSNSVFSAWSVPERQQAFDSFLYAVANTNRSELPIGYLRVARDALIACEELKYTNAVGVAKKMLEHPDDSCGQMAVEILMSLMPPSLEKNGIVLAVTTNSADFNMDLRHWWLYEYAEELCNVPQNDKLVVTNAAELFHKNRRSISNYLALDRVLKTAYTSYSISSNRNQIFNLANASCTLTSVDRNYFIAVTNELANAPQPLGGVPELDDALDGAETE